MDILLKKLPYLEMGHFENDLAELIREKQALINRGYGQEADYKAIFTKLPDIIPSLVDLNADRVKIGSQADMDETACSRLMEVLRELMPWRKGPFDLFDIKIDTEWASDIKWNRLKDEISPLQGKKIMDIGCSSGYHIFRMAGHEPFMVLGLDPMINYHYQYKIIQHYLKNETIFHLPARFEELPEIRSYFDAVFHMGVLYHIKSPVEALANIRKTITPEGELILETLIIEGDTDTALFPRDRYAKMRNVFFIPTVPCLFSWLERAGYKNARCIDISVTTSEEQRKTDWIHNQTLEDFLDPADASKTIEGYPAPVRAVVIANPK
jgi:tRNA (mo5U34)-methyltransferase